MAGTREGGLKAAAKNKEQYGEDFYKRIGGQGGAISKGGLFQKDPEMASLAGRLGGLKSRKDGSNYQPDSEEIKKAQRDIKERKTYRKYNGSDIGR